jgi:hypothetical protein
MKRLRDIVELNKMDIVPSADVGTKPKNDFTQPKSEAEAAFVDKHVVQKVPHPAYEKQEEQDAVFQATNIQKDKSKMSSYHEGEDEEVYEAVEFVRSSLTEDNLEEFDTLLENDRDTAVQFALDIVKELS